MDSTQILNDIEHEKIIAFNEDKIMSQAVQKYLLSHLYQSGVITPGVPHDPTTNWLFQLAAQSLNPNGIPRSSQELGEDLRARAMGLQIIVSGFKELSDIKRKETPENVEENPGL